MVLEPIHQHKVMDGVTSANLEQSLKVLSPQKSMSSIDDNKEHVEKDS
jgi:hypothetical protein